jgi:RNA polymerase sigma-70 factor (ECF subfamily)
MESMSEQPKRAQPDPGDLVRRIHAGDRRAENEFVRRFSPGLLTMLRVRAQDEELCRDLVQDTLTVVLVKIRREGLDEPAAVAGFLRGTALNLLANEMRRSERRLTRRGDEWLLEILDESSDPYDTVESEDLVRAVRNLIGGLKVERDRELLWRHYVLDETKERLCAEFEISSEHFDRVLHRARQRLREALRRAGLKAGDS